MGKRSIAFLIALTVLSGCVSGGAVPSISLVPGLQHPVDKIAARLRKPTGRGPFPAAVLLHGCGGWHGNNIDQWSDWFIGRGYAALAIDSFGTRNITSVCDGSTKLTYLERLGDAYGALSWLRSNNDVDTSRVVLMGFSHGGSTTIAALQSDTIEFFADGLGPDRFAAAVAMYPYCGGAGAQPRVYAPLIIVSGSEDTWTPPFSCQRWVDSSAGFEHPMEMHIIDGATHSFDMSAWNGYPVSARTGPTGHMLAPNASATAEARRLVAEFLQRRAGLP